MILDQISLLDKILILGFAREGQSTQNFLKKRFPRLQIDTADQKDDPNYLSRLSDYKIIIKSPGISPHKPEIEDASKKGVVCTSQTQLFFDLCPGKIIGVTGTKGKSTTASLIYHVLSQNNIKSVMLGNIGKPALDYLDEINKDTWVVMELSSYQLLDLNKSPHIAVLQHIYPDHLDYHKDFSEYKNAKLNITKFQTSSDYLITAKDFPTKAKKIIIKPQPVDSQLLGTHNLYNIQPSIIIGDILGLPKEKILSAIKSFIPLDTRLTKGATVKDITFYEDTLATIPEATIAAIDALSSGVKTLIAGGYERKQKYSKLANKILNSGVSTLILFPATGERIWEEVKKVQTSEIKHFFVNSMSEAVKLAYENTPKGGIVLLSPGAPSFTLFKDYRDESAQYRSAIKNLSAN